MQQLNLDIMEYVENHILPRYADFGKSNGLSHVMRVIKNSMELARFTGADIDMAYVVAAYHDLGMNGPRAIHHLTGGKILASDARLKKWFSPERIYGKIVAEADRDLDTEVVFRRAIQFGLEKYPDITPEQQWERFVMHMTEKYSVNGYIKLWIPNSPNRNKLKQIQTIIESKSMLREWFDMIYQQEVSKT